MKIFVCKKLKTSQKIERFLKYKIIFLALLKQRASAPEVSYGQECQE